MDCNYDGDFGPLCNVGAVLWVYYTLDKQCHHNDNWKTKIKKKSSENMQKYLQKLCIKQEEMLVREKVSQRGH